MERSAARYATDAKAAETLASVVPEGETKEYYAALAQVCKKLAAEYRHRAQQAAE